MYKLITSKEIERLEVLKKIKESGERFSFDENIEYKTLRDRKTASDGCIARKETEERKLKELNK